MNKEVVNANVKSDIKKIDYTSLTCLIIKIISEVNEEKSYHVSMSLILKDEDIQYDDVFGKSFKEEFPADDYMQLLFDRYMKYTEEEMLEVVKKIS